MVINEPPFIASVISISNVLLPSSVVILLKLYVPAGFVKELYSSSLEATVITPVYIFSGSLEELTTISSGFLGAFLITVMCFSSISILVKP